MHVGGRLAAPGRRLEPLPDPGFAPAGEMRKLCCFKMPVNLAFPKVYPVSDRNKTLLFPTLSAEKRQ
jgi:hypothetical protein